MTSALLRMLLAGVIGCLSFPADAGQCGGAGDQLKEPALCSRLFVFAGVCGRPNYPDPAWPDIAFAVGPWEKVPIRIFAVSGDAVVQARWRAVIAKMFLGNSFNADPMTPYINAAGGIMDLSGRVAVPIHVENHFPIGMQLAAPGPNPLAPHLDVHLTCEPKVASYSGSMTVWYGLDP